MISRGADIYARCRWTQMTPLHYAALFDSEPITKILLNANQAIDIDSPCNEYENGSALHIAAHNLAVNSALVLVEFGANTKLKDNLGRTPLGIKQLLLICARPIFYVKRLQNVFRMDQSTSTFHTRSRLSDNCRTFYLEKASPATSRQAEMATRKQLRVWPEELCLKLCGLTLAIEYWWTKLKELR